MCTHIYNKDTGEKTDNPRMFAHMLGLDVKELPVENRFNLLLPDNCLCQVDCRKACELAGFSYVELDNSGLDVVIAKKPYTDSLANIAKNR